MIVLGDGISGVNAKNLKNEYTNKGWTVVNQDLNEGNGGWYVFIAYKTSSTANPYVQQNTLKWTRDSVNIIKKYGDSYTFDVTIENKSGNTEYYTLYNMPQWLSLVGSTVSDEINPLSTKVLRFQVNPLVPVGNYDFNLGVQGNNQILWLSTTHRPSPAT